MQGQRAEGEQHDGSQAEGRGRSVDVGDAGLLCSCVLMLGVLLPMGHA